MINQELKVPFLTEEQITKKADEFRLKYQPNGFPVRVLDILEFSLGIQIIPIPSLEVPHNANAFITAGWDNLYIDKDTFEDERYDKRTNFTVAHEIGHFVLHKSLYESWKIETLEDVYQAVDNIPATAWKRLELQANMFAGKLLVPKNALNTELNKLLLKTKTETVDIGGELSKLFEVSEEVLVTRLNVEKLDLPDEWRQLLS